MVFLPGFDGFLNFTSTRESKTVATKRRAAARVLTRTPPSNFQEKCGQSGAFNQEWTNSDKFLLPTEERPTNPPHTPAPTLAPPFLNKKGQMSKVRLSFLMSPNINVVLTVQFYYIWYLEFNHTLFKNHITLQREKESLYVNDGGQ